MSPEERTRRRAAVGKAASEEIRKRKHFESLEKLKIRAIVARELQRIEYEELKNAVIKAVLPKDPDS